jgi:hypothetical protein
VIDKLLQHFIPTLNDHLSDDRLASLFCKERSFIDRLIAKRHVAKCWRCRARQGDLEGPRADRIMDLYRDALNAEDLTLEPKRRAEFAQRLALHIQQIPPRRRSAFRISKNPLLRLPPMTPSLALFGIFACATFLSFMFWWQRRAPDITSNALLVKAERWDRSNLTASSGVVYQSVRITAPKLTMDRSIYRDLQGKRSLKPVKLAEGQEKLKTELARAGVSWDEPISASDYQAWHDHQHERADKIVRTGTHLLKLTTTVPAGSVSGQSLTVRDTDFHPVRRTVALRDIGTVEIAEFDYKILPWSAVDASVFEPLNDVLPVVSASRARVLQFPKMPEIVTPVQLDEAELGARLVLNQLQADNGEQIEIHRSAVEIEVEGIVETDERKRELQRQLRLVPHVTVSILSTSDLKNMPAGSSTTEIQTASAVDQPSPLEISLRSHGRSVSDINTLAHRLFSIALTISQESKAIADLQARFSPDHEKSILAAATLSELVYSHRERLTAALKSERALVAEARIATTVLTGPFGQRPSSLLDAADRNFALSRELTQTKAPATRSAEQILEEMSISVDDLAAAANDVYGKSPGAPTLSGEK